MDWALQDPRVTRRFRSGRPCLDFVHTGWSGDWAPDELLQDPPSLQRCLEHLLGLAGVHAKPADVEGARRLRAAVCQLARARTAGSDLDQTCVTTVNEFAATPPPVPQLTGDGAALPQLVTADTALSAVARDTIDLLTGPLGHRIGVCQGQGCALLFVDASRPGTRQWCSMQRCGNLAKIRTYRAGARQPSQPEPTEPAPTR